MPARHWTALMALMGSLTWPFSGRWTIRLSRYIALFTCLACSVLFKIKVNFAYNFQKELEKWMIFHVWIILVFQGCEIDILVGTDVRDGNGTACVINWCGCIVQEPHSAVRALGYLPEEGHGVYVARWGLALSLKTIAFLILKWQWQCELLQLCTFSAFDDFARKLQLFIWALLNFGIPQVLRPVGEGFSSDF